MFNAKNLTAVAERIIKRRRWLVEWRTNDCTSANFKLDRTAVKLKDGKHPLQTRHDPHRDRLPWQQLNESERPGIQYLAPKSLIVRHVYNCSRTEIFRELRSILANDGSPNDSIRRFKWEIHQRTFQKNFLKKSAELKNWTKFFSNERTECVKSPEKFNFQRNRIVWLKSVKVVYRHKLTSAGERAKVWRLKRKIHKR